MRRPVGPATVTRAPSASSATGRSKPPISGPMLPPTVIMRRMRVWPTASSASSIACQCLRNARVVVERLLVHGRTHVQYAVGVDGKLPQFRRSAAIATRRFACGKPVRSRRRACDMPPDTIMASPGARGYGLLHALRKRASAGAGRAPDGLPAASRVQALPFGSAGGAGFSAA